MGLFGDICNKNKNPHKRKQNNLMVNNYTFEEYNITTNPLIMQTISG